MLLTTIFVLLIRLHTKTFCEHIQVLLPTYAIMAPAAPQTPNSPFPSPNTVQPSSLSRLTLSDKLLLSQAVHHIGTSPPDWGRVSSILLPHPLIKTKSRLEQAAKAGITLGRVFGSRECERAWVALMRQYNLVLQPGERDVALESENEAGSPAVGNRAKEARGLPPKTDRGSQLALAQFLYAERVREIQEQIKAKEKAFKTLAGEIEALNAGTLDEKLLEELEKSGLLREESEKDAEEKDIAIINDDDESGDLTPPASQSSTSKRELSATPKKTNSTKTSPKVTKDQKPGLTGAHTAASKSPLAEKERGDRARLTNTTKPSKDSKTPSKSIVKDATSPVVADLSTASEEKNGENESKDISAEIGRADESSRDVEMDNSDSAITQDVARGSALSKEDEIASSKRKRDASPSKSDKEEGDEAVVQKKARAEETSTIDLTERTDKAAHSTSQTATQEQAAIGEKTSSNDETKANGDRNTSANNQKEATKEIESVSSKGPISVVENVELTKEDNMDVDETTDEVEEEEETEEVGQIDELKRPEPRRSRRSGRNISVTTDDVPTPPPSATPTTATSAKNSRVEALRSREASGTSADTDEDRTGEEAGDGDGSRSTIDRSRTSLSPVASRRGRGASRQSRRSGGARAPSTGAQVDEVGGSDAERERAAQVIEKRKMEKVLMMLLNEVSNHTHGNLFHNPIKESDAPDYYTLVRHPLDLKTIKARIKEGRITSATQLRRSLMQMFANSLIYNRPGSEIHRMALEMRDAAEDMLDRFDQTQMSAKVSRR